MDIQPSLKADSQLAKACKPAVHPLHHPAVLARPLIRCPHRTLGAANGGVWSNKQLAELEQGIASCPAIPDQVFLGFGVLTKRSLLQANTPCASGIVLH